MDKDEIKRWLEQVISDVVPLSDVAPLSVSPSLALTQGPSGCVRITDRGQTLARAPRLASVVSRQNGMSARLFRSVLAHHGLTEAHGTIYSDVPKDRVGGGVFRFLEALARLREILGLPAL